MPRNGLIAMLTALDRRLGTAAYVGNRCPAVHFSDAARQFRLTPEEPPTGAVVHAVAEDGVPVREVAEAIVARLLRGVAGASKGRRRRRAHVHAQTGGRRSHRRRPPPLERQVVLHRSS